MAEKDCIRRSKGEEFPSKMVGRHSLKSWGYRLGMLKGLFLENNGFDVWSRELEEYCVQDTKLTAELLSRLTNDNYTEVAIDMEHRFAEIMTLQELRGFGFDTAMAGALYAELAV